MPIAYLRQVLARIEAKPYPSKRLINACPQVFRPSYGPNASIFLCELTGVFCRSYMNFPP